MKIAKPKKITKAGKTKKAANRIGVGRVAFLPVGLNRNPEIAQPFFVSVAVLHNQSLNSFGMLRG
jgi:hypothetical protein